MSGDGIAKWYPSYRSFSLSAASSGVVPSLWASSAMSSCIRLCSSSALMPHTAAYSGSMVMFLMLFSSLNMLSWENFVMPVRKTKRRCGSQAFRGL